MFFYNATQGGPFAHPVVHDPDTVQVYGFKYAFDRWQANKVYRHDTGAIIPTVFGGVYYSVVNPGVSGATEPVWNNTLDEETQDGTVVWVARPYHLLLNPDEETLVGSNWTATPGVTLSNSAFTADGQAYVQVDSVEEDVQSFTLTNRITIAPSNVSFDRSILIEVANT